MIFPGSSTIKFNEIKEKLLNLFNADSVNKPSQYTKLVFKVLSDIIKLLFDLLCMFPFVVMQPDQAIIL